MELKSKISVAQYTSDFFLFPHIPKMLYCLCPWFVQRHWWLFPVFPDSKLLIFFLNFSQQRESSQVSASIYLSSKCRHRNNYVSPFLFLHFMVLQNQNQTSPWMVYSKFIVKMMYCWVLGTQSLLRVGPNTARDNLNPKLAVCLCFSTENSNRLAAECKAWTGLTCWISGWTRKSLILL